MTVLSGNTIKRLCLQNPPLITEFVDMDKQIQQNGVDFTVKKIEHIDGQGTIDFDNKSRVLPSTRSVAVYQIAANGDKVYDLPPGCYLVTFNEFVNIPKDLMCRSVSRSTLIRCGASLESAIWDAGFSGYSQCALNVHNPEGIRIHKDARIMQLVVEELSDCVTEGYNGIYQNFGKGEIIW